MFRSQKYYTFQNLKSIGTRYGVNNILKIRFKNVQYVQQRVMYKKHINI